jgi:ketosteroid isomerase-like protein
MVADLASGIRRYGDEFETRFPDRGPLAGDHYGRDAVFEMFGQQVEASEGTFTQELHDVAASDDHAVALTNVTARRGDHKYDSQDVWVLHLREGEIADAWWRPEDLYAADEFWT